jgi:copper(I)-binding protein
MCCTGRWSGGCRAIGMFLCLLLGVAAVHPAVAGSPVRLEAPWARASLGGVRNAIVYGVLVNDGPDPARIVGGSTPLAAGVEFHIHAMEGTVMTMRQLESIEIKPGEKSILEPGGLHIMLIDLKRPLKEGESFPLTLNLSDGGSLAVEVKVISPTATGPTP